MTPAGQATVERVAEALVTTAAGAQSQDEAVRIIARDTGLSQACVDHVMKRQTHVLRSLAPYNREYHQALLGHRVLQTLEKADPEVVSAKEMQAYSVAVGILTDKGLLLQGQPTEIHGHLHEHRLMLPELLGRAARALSAMSTEAGQCQDTGA